MTQYIAETPLHCVIRSEVKALHDTAGRMIAPKKQRVYAKFRRGEAPAYAYEVGKSLFEFRGMPQGVTLEQWMAYYDSAEDQVRMNWSDEERQAIEDKLATRPGVVVIEPPKVPAPWATYDKLTIQGKRNATQVAEKNIEIANETGVDLELLIAYEASTRNDERIIGLYHAANAPVEVPVEEEVVA